MVGKGATGKGAASKRAASKGTAAKGTASKGTASKGTAAKGTASKGTASKGAARTGTASKAVVARRSATGAKAPAPARAGGARSGRRVGPSSSPDGRKEAVATVLAARSADASPLTGGRPSRSRDMRRQGQETLRRLLEAAIIVFDQRGYGGARVDDIVRQAGTSHGTFYLYFANKEDLFDTLITGVTEEMRELAVDLPSVAPGRRGYDDLREWVGRFYDLYAHYYPVIRSWSEMNQQNTELARKGAYVLRRFINHLVSRVREIDPMPVADPETAAMAMLSMVERATFYALVGLVPVERDNLLDHLASILHVGLFGGARRKAGRARAER
jgi:AcrR family transcriptional regulator